MADDKVQWPGAAYSSGEDDLSVPIKNMLKAIRNIGNPAGETQGATTNGPVTLTGGTPYSLQVITAGASSLTKWWSSFVAGLGGLGAVGLAIKGIWAEQEVPVQVVSIGSAAVLGSAAFVSVAVIVKADVMARGVASAARKQATSEITTAMLNNFQHARALVPPTFDNLYVVKRNVPGAQWERVTEFLWDNGQLKVRINKYTLGAGDIADILDLRDVVPAQK
jgi:hypothetical protein